VGADREKDVVNSAVPAASSRPLGNFMLGPEFCHHRGKAAAAAVRRARRQTAAEPAGRNRGTRVEAVPRKSTPPSERNTRAGLGPRAARPARR
jgi:hypothetical protein